jgi:hypothetical protein
VLRQQIGAIGDPLAQRAIGKGGDRRPEEQREDGDAEAQPPRAARQMGCMIGHEQAEHSMIGGAGSRSRSFDYAASRLRSG